MAWKLANSGWLMSRHSSQSEKSRHESIQLMPDTVCRDYDTSLVRWHASIRGHYVFPQEFDTLRLHLKGSRSPLQQFTVQQVSSQTTPMSMKVEKKGTITWRCHPLRRKKKRMTLRNMLDSMLCWAQPNKCYIYFKTLYVVSFLMLNDPECSCDITVIWTWRVC